MPTLISPIGEVAYPINGTVTFTWGVAWSYAQGSYEVAWKRASDTAWNTTGYVAQARPADGQGSHDLVAEELVPNIRYTWKVRLTSAPPGSDHYKSGWSEIGMFVLAGVQNGLVHMGDEDDIPTQLRGIQVGQTNNHSGIMLGEPGQINEVQTTAENTTEVNVIDDPANPRWGKRWEIAPGESQGPGAPGYGDYQDHSDTAYSQYYDYYNYGNYGNYYNVYGNYGNVYYNAVYYNYGNYGDYGRDYYSEYYDVYGLDGYSESGGYPDWNNDYYGDYDPYSDNWWN